MPPYTKFQRMRKSIQFAYWFENSSNWSQTISTFFGSVTSNERKFFDNSTKKEREHIMVFECIGYDGWFQPIRFECENSAFTNDKHISNWIDQKGGSFLNPICLQICCICLIVCWCQSVESWLLTSYLRIPSTNCWKQASKQRPAHKRCGYLSRVLDGNKVDNYIV